METSPRAEPEAKRVPRARFLDVDGVPDPSSPLPHMLPDAGAFAAACDAVGVANGDQVVVYDGAGLFSAARGWWMFKVFGHDAVALLDGGMRAWEKLDGAPVETTLPAVPIAAAADACARWYDDASNAAASTPPSSFRATLRPDLVLGRGDVLARCPARGSGAAACRAARASRSSTSSTRTIGRSSPGTRFATSSPPRARM